MKFPFTIQDPFWTHYQTLIKDTVIPYQKQILEDALPDVEKSHAIENFRIAAGLSSGDFYGMVFQDSDVAKWLEAASYSLMLQRDEKLEAEIDELISIIGKAQLPDGYLDTYFIIKEPHHRWENLREGHELYCFGHMMEAAVAYYRATGKNTLLHIMEKNAAHIADRFGKNKVRGYPGHPEIELALLRMYEVTSNQMFLDLASYFIDERGTAPDFFTEESERINWHVWGDYNHDPQYNQAHLPVREQTTATGHAVRAVYLYTGMAHMASLTEDNSLTTACKRLWKNITTKQMYVTGGIGSTHEGEAFSTDYDLPNDTAYAETCASIGLVFFAKRMMELEINSEYADVMERAIYNGIISGMSQDGKKFFYVNPLSVNPDFSGKIPGHKHVCPTRPSWYGCACCPPNVARLISSLGDYVWMKKDDIYYSNLFIGGIYQDPDDTDFTIELTSELPLHGNLHYTIHTKENTQKTIAIRIPSWTDSAAFVINGISIQPEIKSGYAYLETTFSDGDVINVTFTMEAKRIYSNPNLSKNAGHVSFQRGPFIYCIEGVDHPGGLSHYFAKEDGFLLIKKSSDVSLDDIPVLSIEGYKMDSSPEDKLYSYKKNALSPATLTAIPYFFWDNRGLNEMKVWIPEIK